MAFQRPEHPHPRDIIQLPAISEPHQGTSYNPPVEAHTELILKASEVEVKRAKEADRMMEVKNRIGRAVVGKAAWEGDGVEGMIVDDGVDGAADLDPLLPPPAADSASEPTSSSAEAQATSHHAALQAAAEAAGIDPSLAYLDPSLVGGPVAAGGSAPNTFTAKFNARTGAFTAGDARDPGHLSEYEVSVGFAYIIVLILSRSVLILMVSLPIKSLTTPPYSVQNA